MKTAHILLLCILGAALLFTVDCSNSANGPDNCCFKFYPRRINKNLIISYTVTDHRCPKAGVILVTKRSREVCADPSLTWVEDIMKTVDENSF